VVIDSNGGRSDERSSDMTLEEIEFKQQYPRIPEERVPAVLAEVKRQRALAEAKRAAERGWDTRVLSESDPR